MGETDGSSPASGVQSQRITLRSEAGAQVSTFVARPAHPTGVGVLILPDADGLGLCYEELALRFAEHGIDAVAIDYYERAPNQDEDEDEDELGRGSPWEERFALLRASDVADAAVRAVAHLRSPEGNGARFVFALGFGFGGGHAWLLAAAGLGLSGAIGFYGRPNPTNREDEPAPIESVREFGCPILGLFGWRDPAVSPTWIVAFERALSTAGLPHQLAVYRRTGAGFFERHAAEYPEAAVDAWQRVFRFLEACSGDLEPHLEPYVVVGELPSPEPPDPSPAPRLMPTAPAFPPLESDGGWPVLADRREIAARGLDPDGLDELGSWMATLQYPAPFPPSPWGFLVIREGQIVAERYDDPRTRCVRQGIASIGKSLSSLAFGRWLEASRQGNAHRDLELDSLVYDPRWMPEGFPLSDPRKEAVTFRHLLTHTSGIRPEWDFRGGVGFDFVQYTVGKTVAYPDSARLCFDPGKGYGYSSVAFNHFAIVAPHLVGRYLHEEIRDEILAPIGADSTAWRLPDGEYFGYEDPSGRYMPGSGGPHLTARDLARYAYLHLKKGQWAGRSLVPEWYMEIARQVDLVNPSQPNDYGLGFWSNDRLGMSPELPRDAFGLGGNGLNMVLIVPSWDLIVLHTSRVYWVFDFDQVRRELIRRVIRLIR